MRTFTNKTGEQEQLALLHWRFRDCENAFAPRRQSAVPLGPGLVPGVCLIWTTSRWRNGRTKQSVSSRWLERRPNGRRAPRRDVLRCSRKCKRRLRKNSRRKKTIMSAMQDNPIRNHPATHRSFLLPACVLQGMTGQRNEMGTKKASEFHLQGQQRNSFLRPGLAIPCQVARQQSLTPFHQAM
jgi:hypothetical protein